MKADTINLAVKDYVAHCNSEPEKDCWDTETGEPEPGAQKFASDLSWHEWYEKKRALFTRLETFA